MIEIVAFVLENGYLTEDGETVGETSWNEELEVVVFGQFYGYVLAICRGAFADIDGYVEDCAFDTADELGLSEWWALEVEAAHHAVGGAGFVVLDEVDFSNFLVEFVFIVTFEEIAS